ncbi:MAG: helix-turn-helix domain-containing protein [Methyloceanibacter sp.]|jgi:hypothetical protein
MSGSAKVAKVRELHKDGIGALEIARQVGISRTTVLAGAMTPSPCDLSHIPTP